MQHNLLLDEANRKPVAHYEILLSQLLKKGWVVGRTVCNTNL